MVNMVRVLLFFRFNLGNIIWYRGHQQLNLQSSNQKTIDKCQQGYTCNPFFKATISDSINSILLACFAILSFA